MQARTRDWIGRGVVAAVMTLGIMLTGCGGDDVADDRGPDPRLPRETAVTVQPAAIVTETAAPVTEPTLVVTGPVSYETAESAWRDGRYRDAVALFTRYTDDRPGNPWGHYMLGLSARRAGDLVTAERAFATALTADAEHVKSLLNLTRTLLDLERPAEAVETAERAIALAPSDPEGYRLRGLAFADQGREIDAIASYREALLRDPEDAWSANNLGLLHIRAGRFDEAVGPLALAATGRPEVAVFRNNLGVALERVHAFAQAAEQYAAAAASGHGRAAASLERIRAHEAEGVVIDLVRRVEEFRLGLTAGVPEAARDSIETLPGESQTLGMLYEEVARRWARR